MKTQLQKKLSRKNRGQGMTEYIIIVALIAIAAIGVYSAFGHTLQGQVAQVTSAVAGGTTATGKNIATAGAQSANADATKTEGLLDYSQNATAQ